MRKYYLITLTIITIVFGSLSLYAESNIIFGGSFQTDNRMYLKNNNDFSWQEYRLDLDLDANISDNVHFYSDFWVRSLGFPNIQKSSDLFQSKMVTPQKFELKEGYFDIYGLFSENLDVRIGRQRITWGSADKLNPTDNLNPDDLEDIWDFGRHLASDGISTKYYLGDYELSAVFIPSFSPAVFPGGNWATALSPSLDLPTGLSLGSFSDKIILPENNIKESATTGVKVAGNLFDYDFSLSYVHGRDDLPLINKVIITPIDTVGTVEISTEMIFPKMQIVGFDMAGTVGDVGVWAESAIFFPERIIQETDLSGLGMGTQESVVLDDAPYVKYVVGADYTFTNGIYINTQYLHGFIHEKEESIEDYYMFGLEKKLFEDRLKITPLSGGLEVKNYDNFEDNYAIIFSPEIAYSPYDNIEFIFGAYIIEGNKSSTFGKMKDYDDVYLKTKVNF